MNTTPLFEGPSLKAWKSWFGNRPVINAGPTDFEIVVSSEEKSAETRKIIAFLDSILEKFGPDSVVYVRLHSTAFFIYSICSSTDIIWFSMVDLRAGKGLGSHRRSHRAQYSLCKCFIKSCSEPFYSQH